MIVKLNSIDKSIVNAENFYFFGLNYLTSQLYLDFSYYFFCLYKISLSSSKTNTINVLYLETIVLELLFNHE